MGAGLRFPPAVLPGGGSDKRFLNDYLTGKWEGSPARGELYNDDPRLGDARLCGTTASLCGIESALQSGDKKALNKALKLDQMLHAFMFTLSGVPVLYSGDEIAQENDYSYHDNPHKADDSRYLHRGSMDWEKAKNRTKKTTPEGKMFAAIRQMEQIRAEQAVFDTEADTWVLDTCNDHVLGIGRYYRSEQLLALFNFSDKPQKIWLRDEKIYKDMVTGKEGDAGEIRLDAGEFRWLLHRF